MLIDTGLTFASLAPAAERVFELAGGKIRAIDRAWPGGSGRGSPVLTVQGRYTGRGWTEWTQGFQYGCGLLAFDGTGDRKLLDLGRKRTVDHMAPHLTHAGVHDHGFNNLSTYGNLRRLMLEGRIPHNDWELDYYYLALKTSGAVQAMRWSGVAVREPSPHSANTASLGYIYSFNGPHSLFVDTMRTTRSLGLAWRLGQVLMHENDKAASLLKRSVLHGLATSQYLVCHGDTTHTYDAAGRTAHEAIFNRNDGSFCCLSTQQGYSPFSTWTRGLAWAMLGYAEELEFFRTIAPAEFKRQTGLERKAVIAVYERCAVETCDHYINNAAAADGVPYWDDGAPGLVHMADWRERPADPFNDWESVDSSAAVIAAQGLLRFGRYLGRTGRRYSAAGLTIARTLFQAPYLSAAAGHQGLLLHSVYHRPNNWDYTPPGRKIPCGESSLWGDYHALELALLIQRLAKKAAYPTFFA